MDDNTVWLFLAAGCGYLLGSIPFGLLLTRVAGLGDIRSIGSGNIGATNVLRTGHKGLAAGTLLLDALKGTLAVAAGGLMAGGSAVAAGAEPVAGAALGGLAAFLGHLFPVWLGFRGGKGVATYIGVLAGLSLVLAGLFCTVWLIVAVASRYSSLSALLAAVALPVAAYFLSGPTIAVATLVMSSFLIWKHKPNIERLVAGQESKIGGG